MLYSGGEEPPPGPLQLGPVPYEEVWRVDSGSCYIRDFCIQSPNFPGMYGNMQKCLIAINEEFWATHWMRSVSFESEQCCDKLKINGRDISGPMFPDGVRPMKAMTWASDRSNIGAGFRICPWPPVP